MRPLALLLALTACTGAAVSTTDSTPRDSGWVEVAEMAVARSEHPAAALDGEMVVIGGFTERGLGGIDVTRSVEAYSLTDDTWRDLPDLPEPRHHGMAAVVDDRLFVLGGYSTSGVPTVDVWELVDGGWVDRAPIPGPVAAGAAAALGQAIYLVGGTPNGGFYRYDVGPDAWIELTGPARREHLASVAFEGEIWAIAGRWPGHVFAAIEIYDPEAGAWGRGPDLIEARSGFGAVVIDDGIVVAGGEVFDPNRTLDSVERLDAETGAWALIDPLPYGLHGNPLVAIAGDIYLPGGSTRAADVENDGRTWRLSVE